MTKPVMDHEQKPIPKSLLLRMEELHIHHEVTLVRRGALLIDLRMIGAFPAHRP